MAENRRPMSDSHKEALREGRAQSRAVRRYLEALETRKPKRGRKRTPESIGKRLATIEASLPNADPLRRVQLVQEQMDLTAELERLNEKVDLTELENGFVDAAKGYSQSKGLTYTAWRSVGVPAELLQRAGISRGD